MLCRACCMGRHLPFLVVAFQKHPRKVRESERERLVVCARTLGVAMRGRGREWEGTLSKMGLLSSARGDASGPSIAN